jgi:hypothetical protein
VKTPCRAERVSYNDRALSLVPCHANTTYRTRLRIAAATQVHSPRLTFIALRHTPITHPPGPHPPLSYDLISDLPTNEASARWSGLPASLTSAAPNFERGPPSLFPQPPSSMDNKLNLLMCK